jgi:Xaa-Pro aminopeptidase
VYAIVRDTLAATLAMARPGVRAAELHRAAFDMLGRHDLAQYFTHRAGHGIGLETSLEPIDLRRDQMELRLGMTFCVEPGVYIPGFGGIKIEDDVIVTEDEPEIISHATRELVPL